MNINKMSRTFADNFCQQMSTKIRPKFIKNLEKNLW